MTFNMLLQVLKSRLWLILLLPLAAAATALAFGLAERPQYAASATVVLDYRKPLKGELAGELLPVGLQSSYLATQVDIIRSRPVAERVVERLGLMDSPLWRERFAEAQTGDDLGYQSWLLTTLRESVDVRVRVDSRLISVWYRDADPQVAADIANAFVAAYREINEQLVQSPSVDTAQSVQFVLDELRGKLKEAENNVGRYQASAGIMATDERLDVETAQLDELMRRRVAAEADLRIAESRLAAAQALATDGAELGVGAEALGSELIGSLRLALARKEAEIAERATSLGERHPQMRQLRAEQAALQGQLAAEKRRVVDGIRGDWLQARGLADSAAAAETAQKARLIEFKQAREGLQPLIRELENARASYDRALQMSSEYAMHSNLNQTNVSLLDAAQPPVLPSGRGLLRTIVGAFIGGLALALGIVLLWELANRRVHDGDDVADVGVAGFLGALPRA